MLIVCVCGLRGFGSRMRVVCRILRFVRGFGVCL